MSTRLPDVFDELAGAVGFGSTVTLTRTLPGPYDPLLGSPGAPVTTNFNVTALVESFPMTDKRGDETNVESIQRGDLRIQVKVSDLSVTLPDPQGDAVWTATVNGAELRVLETDVVNGEIYALHARR